ncbi:MAG: NAD(P)-binding protein [Chloroflexi bacterium]|nr:NAD(P)-binding protein [Chloroflexota bacterium]MYD47794.1 NAD(P)-binding protein [Chloroflexota bacterium]
MRYDLAIIGAGSAGLTAARFAARLGKRIALIEANRVGGDCTWTGCVPSKALLHAARVAHAIRNAGRYGIAASDPSVDFRTVMSRIRAAIEQIYAAESPDALRAEGIDVIEERAEFADSRTVSAGGRRITAKRFLICTGASPFVPPVPGLTDVPYLTYETFWQLESLPSRLTVIGGGPIGCELAQACQRLGSQVTLAEALPRILPNDEPDAAAIVASSLRRDGVELRLSSPVESVRRSDDGITVTAAGDDIAGDGLLVALGRRPNVVGLGLEAAGVDCGDAGIVVDDYLRTGARDIYAAGDCIGGFQFTHYAGFQGAMAVRNMMLPGRSRARPAHPPWATFTDPEAAHVGYTEEQARQQFGDQTLVSTLPMESIDRAVTDDAGDGFIKVVHRSNGTVLGATVVGRQAAEALQGWSIAAARGLRMGHVAQVMQAYPSLATGNQQIAWDAYLDGLTQGFAGRALRWLSR